MIIDLKIHVANRLVQSKKLLTQRGMLSESNQKKLSRHVDHLRLIMNKYAWLRPVDDGYNDPDAGLYPIPKQFQTDFSSSRNNVNPGYPDPVGDFVARWSLTKHECELNDKFISDSSIDLKPKK